MSFILRLICLILLQYEAILEKHERAIHEAEVNDNLRLPPRSSYLYFPDADDDADADADDDDADPTRNANPNANPSTNPTLTVNPGLRIVSANSARRET